MNETCEINGKEYIIETFLEKGGYYSAIYQFYQKGSTIPLISLACNEAMRKISDTDEQRLIRRVIHQIRKDTSRQ